MKCSPTVDDVGFGGYNEGFGNASLTALLGTLFCSEALLFGGFLTTYFDAGEYSLLDLFIYLAAMELSGEVTK